jgi:hypothetical protein
MSIIQFRLVPVIEALNHHAYKHGRYDEDYKRNMRYLHLLYEGLSRGWDDWSWGRAVMSGMLCREDYELFPELQDRDPKEDFELYRNRNNINVEGLDPRSKLQTRVSWAAEHAISAQEDLSRAISNLSANSGYDTFEEFIDEVRSCQVRLNEASIKLNNAKRELADGMIGADNIIAEIDEEVKKVKKKYNISECEDEDDEEDEPTS